MRRLLALAVPLALMMGTGCVAHVHGPARHHAPVQVIEYSYSSDHPIPDDFGGGWCPYSHVHVHDYEPTTTYYVYSDDAYYYSGPSVVWYWNDHPHAHGGLCNMHGRHSHDYYPSTGSIYRYERNRGYVWSRTHSASAGYGYVRPATRPSNRPVVPGNTYSGTRPPPGGTRWTTPRGSNSGGNHRPSRGQSDNAGSGWSSPPSGRTSSNNSGSGWSSPPAGRTSNNVAPSNNSGSGRSSPPAGRTTNNAAPKDDDSRDNDSGNRWGSGNSGSSGSSRSNNSSSSGSSNSGSSGSGWGRGGSSSGNSGSSGSSNRSGSSGSGSGSSGSGWGRGGSSSGSSSSGSSAPPSGRSGSSSSSGGNGRWR
ncbi:MULTISPECIES: hypothetical protein [Myxococcus]|uniref:hypothetical protein n=1 Tax=Myxococcus TaxID=32 RepID=UPI00129C3754|nr:MULTISPECIES: hypothetical protein [Myxococcus]NOK02503.1 hypothetical protein [Myxococcus xanthus]